MGHPHVRQAILRNRISQLLGSSAGSASRPTVQSSEFRPERGAIGITKAVVTPNEVNNRHGTGTFVRAMFSDQRSLLSIWSSNDYERDCDFGAAAIRLEHSANLRCGAFAAVAELADTFALNQVSCVPYNPADAYASIALKEVFDAHLGVHMMDDTNVAGHNMPDN